MTKKSLALVAAIAAAFPSITVAQDTAAPAADPAKSGGAFPNDKERQSYAVGMFFGQRAKNGLPDPEAMDVDALIEGLQSVLSGDKGDAYAYGVSVALDLKRNKVEVDPSVVVEAMRAQLTGKATKLDDSEMQTAMNELRQEMQKAAMEERQNKQKEWEAKMAEVAPKNKAEGEAFLAENAKKDGVVATDSGLQYEVLEEGAGAEKPGDKDRVVVNYKGTLLDGTVFDQSPEGKPRTFGVNRVIPGWTEGLKLMSKGSKLRLWIPGEIAYGMKPRMGGKIEAMDTLVFDVELVDIKKAPVTATPPVAVPTGNKRKPITAVTPPVAVEIPPRKKDGEKNKDGKKPEVKEK